MYRQSILQLSLTVQRGMIPKKHTKKNGKNMTFAEKKRSPYFESKSEQAKIGKMSLMLFTLSRKRVNQNYN